jgi:hypothetical protein
MIAARIGLHHTGIDSEPLTPDESGRHAGRNDALEYVAKHVAFTKSMQPVLREGLCTDQESDREDGGEFFLIPNRISVANQ